MHLKPTWDEKNCPKATFIINEKKEQQRILFLRKPQVMKVETEAGFGHTRGRVDKL